MAHVHKRGSKWSVVYDAPRLPGEKRKQVWESGFRDEKAARRRADAVEFELREGTHVPQTRLRFGEFLLEQWLPTIERNGRLKPATIFSYRREIENHVLPRLGGIKLRSLNAVHLNGLYGDLLTSGRKDGRGGLSPNSVLYVHRIIHKALEDAVRWNVVGRNVANAADPPRRVKPVMAVWDAGEAREFLAHARGSRLFACFLLALTTGMRRGELAALRWSDVDLEHALVRVDSNRVSVGYEVIEGTPKQESDRELPLDRESVATLRRLRAVAAARWLGAPGTAPDEYIFVNESGEPIHPESISAEFRRLVRSHGELPRIRFHDVRHTHATLGLASGVPSKVMADRLGHKQVSTTNDMYTHVLPTMQEDATERIANLLFPPDEGTAS